MRYVLWFAIFGAPLWAPLALQAITQRIDKALARRQGRGGRGVGTHAD